MHIFIISLFFALCIAAPKPQSQSQSAVQAEVETAFVNLLNDADIFASVVKNFISRLDADIPNDAQSLLYAQEDQDAQVALLANFGGDIGNQYFNTIQATNALITTGIQSIILTPTTDNAQLEAEAIASARYVNNFLVNIGI
jgi:hypothetical protein